MPDQGLSRDLGSKDAIQVMLEKAGKGQLLPGVRVYKSQPHSSLDSAAGGGSNAVFRESRKNITLQVLPWWHLLVTCSLLSTCFTQGYGKARALTLLGLCEVMQNTAQSSCVTA